MIRIASIAKPKHDGEATRRMYAFLASCVLHGLMLGLLLWVTYLYEMRPRAPLASAPGVPSITLSTLVIVSPPKPPPPTPIPDKPVPQVKPKSPDIGVPVLSAHPVKPVAPPQALSKAAPKVTGINVMPDPPYPTEAWNLQQTGTVYVAVLFDESGNVSSVKVERSSGKPLLDRSTVSFIRSHWHSTTYAGQNVNLPIKYQLEK